MYSSSASRNRRCQLTWGRDIYASLPDRADIKAIEKTLSAFMGAI